MTMDEVRSVVQEALNRVRVHIFTVNDCDAQVSQALWVYYTQNGVHETWTEIYLQRGERQVRTKDGSIMIDFQHANSDTHVG